MRRLYEFWLSVKRSDKSPTADVAVGVLFFLYLLFALIFSLTSPAAAHRQADRFILSQAETLARHWQLYDTLTPLAMAKLFLLSLPLRYLLNADPSVQLFWLRLLGVLIGAGILGALLLASRNLVKHRLFQLMVVGSLALNPWFIVKMTTLGADKLVMLLVASLTWQLTEIVKEKAKLIDVAAGLVVVYLIFRLVPRIGLAVALPAFIMALALGAYWEYGRGLDARLRKISYGYLGLLVASVIIAFIVTNIPGLPEPVVFPAQSVIEPLASIRAGGSILSGQARLASTAIDGLPAGFSWLQKVFEYALLGTGLVSLVGLAGLFISSLAGRESNGERTGFTGTLVPVAILALLIFSAWGLWSAPRGLDPLVQALGMTMLAIFFVIGLFEVSVTRKSILGDLAVLLLSTLGLGTLLIIALFQ